MEGEGGSLVEQAVEVIRRAAANASAYQLDLKKVFVTFDTSGDGFLSCQEMVRNLYNQFCLFSLSNAFIFH